jgi:hypothetical protein
MHQIPTDEALHWARLYQREQACQAERDHLANTTDRPARSHVLLDSLVEGPVRVVAMMTFLIELLVLAVK